MASSLGEMQFHIEHVLTELNGLLDFCKELDIVQKQSVTKIGSILEPFLHKTYHVSLENANSVSNLEGYKKFLDSYSVWNLLAPVQSQLEKLLSDVADTRSMAGNNAFLSALDMYDELSVKKLTDKQAFSVSNELRDYFPNSKKLVNIV